MTASELRRVLKQDSTAWLDGSRMYYVDPAPEPVIRRAAAEAPPFPRPDLPAAQQARVAQDAAAWTSTEPPSAGQLERQRARPAERRLPGLDLDGDAATFNPRRARDHPDVWQRVAEDYAPFDIDVTTQDPGLTGHRTANDGDPLYGTRALITPSDAAETRSAAAVQLGLRRRGLHRRLRQLVVGSSTLHQPAWVFPQELGQTPSASPRRPATRSGHNFGLSTTACRPGRYYTATHVGADHGRRLRPPDRAVEQGRVREREQHPQDDLAIIAAKTPYRPTRPAAPSAPRAAP